MILNSHHSTLLEVLNYLLFDLIDSMDNARHSTKRGLHMWHEQTHCVCQQLKLELNVALKQQLLSILSEGRSLVVNSNRRIRLPNCFIKLALFGYLVTCALSTHCCNELVSFLQPFVALCSFRFCNRAASFTVSSICAQCSASLFDSHQSDTYALPLMSIGTTSVVMATNRRVAISSVWNSEVNFLQWNTTLHMVRFFHQNQYLGEN